MVYTSYDGIFTGGLLTFLLVLISILTIASLIWGILYTEMSQRKSKRNSILIVIINALLITFEIQLILLKANVII